MKEKTDALNDTKILMLCMVKKRTRNKFKRKINNHENHLTHNKMLSLFFLKSFFTSRLIS